MKNFILSYNHILHVIILTFALGFNACSGDDENSDRNGNNAKNDARIKLVSSKSEIFPFEDIKVSVDVDLKLLQKNYDSITWKANGTAYQWSFFGSPWSHIDNERDVRITDYRMGTHKVYALGYKNGTVASKDSIEYQVKTPKGDFINLYWNKNTKNQYLCYSTGVTPNQYLPDYEDRIKIGGVSLMLDHIVEEKNKEYATLSFMLWSSSTNVRTRTLPDINNFDWHDKSDEGHLARCNMEYTFLHNYLTELYGAPQLIDTGDDVTKTTLKEEYAKRFTYDIIDKRRRYPVEIWDTPKSVICLARANDFYWGKNQKGISVVIAEPRK